MDKIPLLRKIVPAFNLFKDAFGKYWKQISILTALGLLGGLLEAIGINALIPLFSFFTGGEGGNDLISQFIVKFFETFNIQFGLIQLLVFIVALFFLKAFVLIGFNFIGINIRNNYEKEMRNTLFGRILKSSWPHLMKQKLGHLETILTLDVRMGTKLFAVIANSLMLVTSLLMYIIVAVNISPSITLITFAVGMIFFFSMKPFLRIMRAMSKKTAAINKEVAHIVGESILGMKTIKSMSKEDVFLEKGDKKFENLKNFQVRTARMSTWFTAFTQPLSIVIISLVFGFSYYYTENFNFAAVAALIYLIHRIFTYIQMLQNNVQNMNKMVPYLQAVLSYRKESDNNREKNKGKEEFIFEEKLQFNNVKFSYDDSQIILKDINLKIKKGEMIGLIGTSGAGKTTLFDLMLRLFKPSSGAILLDGRDISYINLEEWRNKISYVSQDLFLLNDTIASNIKFYDDLVKEEDVVEASKKAYIYDFIKSLPDGFETMIGERGMRLSAGQRQRIAIARALARKPEILLLDEATSALDNESEIEIQNALMKLKGEITIIAIAHRLSTVTNSDKLFVLEHGTIVEQGVPQELLDNSDSYFYKVYNIRK